MRRRVGRMGHRWVAALAVRPRTLLPSRVCPPSGGASQATRFTEGMKAQVLEGPGRRCECVSKNCRHHRGGSRCPKGLRGSEWTMYYRTESPGANL